MKKIFFSIYSIFICISSFAQDSLNIEPLTVDSLQVTQTSYSDTKSDADSAYIKNDYSTAIQIYENLLQQGESAELYYNLGNSYYKSGDIARAILNYERALLLKPGNEDIRANLEIARSKTVDKIDAVPEIFFVSWTKSLINSISINAWARWGIIFFILLIASLYFFIFSKQVTMKKVGFISSLVCLLFAVCTNMFASYQKKTLTNRNTAIIISPSVTIRSTPNENGTSLFVLHEGSKVVIKDNSMNSWKEITIEDGKVGWISSSDIEII
ncbi:tetratricopeptide repeat protein [Bacteroides sp. 51]|uniref:tetratricopeptide repeat protein n=1 Tax=Bacteroides sp. 51 TaxID=2302938 RepID=UPI0013D00F2F|nr:tetratricopeptide repeat protein [Bacteroides sp. 51]NDV83749.1 tetratricopeptide repeat protein [Bacteroides sp. 51]